MFQFAGAKVKSCALAGAGLAATSGSTQPETSHGLSLEKYPNPR